MNKVVSIGRLTDDPKVRGEGEKKCARYTLALDRYKDGADFPAYVCWGKTAEFAEKYLRKGMKIAVVGRITTGAYTDKEGKKVYTTEVTVENHEFCEKRSDDNNPPSAPDDFLEASGIPDLPF